MASPSLTGLPRELRNIIYTYLHHEVALRLSWEPSRSADVVFPNVPEAGLLNTKWQLCHKYYEAPWARSVSASFEFHLHHVERPPEDEQMALEDHINILLAHTLHVEAVVSPDHRVPFLYVQVFCGSYVAARPCP
jgi:hypothetical protein